MEFVPTTLDVAEHRESVMRSVEFVYRGAQISNRADPNMAAAALRLFERLKDLGINITQVRAHTTSEKMLFDEHFSDFLEKLTISQWRLRANTAEERSALNAQINIYNQLVGNRLRKCTQVKEVIQQTVGTRWRFVVLPTFPRPDKTKTTITTTIEGVSERAFQLGCKSNRLLNCVASL